MMELIMKNRGMNLFIYADRISNSDKHLSAVQAIADLEVRAVIRSYKAKGKKQDPQPEPKIFNCLEFEIFPAIQGESFYIRFELLKEDLEKLLANFDTTAVDLTNLEEVW